MKRHSRTLIKAIRDNIGGFPRTGVEVGVWRGVMSATLLRAFRRMHLTMVDSWLASNKESSMGLVPEWKMLEAMKEAFDRTQFAESRRTIVRSDSLFAAKRIVDESQCFVFIDCSHLYADVKADTEAYYPKVKSGGVLSWHDYGGMGDKRRGWGVKRAVDEFAAEYGYEVHSNHIVAWVVKK